MIMMIAVVIVVIFILVMINPVCDNYDDHDDDADNDDDDDDDHDSLSPPRTSDCKPANSTLQRNLDDHDDRCGDCCNLHFSHV